MFQKSKYRDFKIPYLLSKKRKSYLKLMSRLSNNKYNSSMFKWKIGYFPVLGYRWINQRISSL